MNSEKDKTTILNPKEVKGNIEFKKVCFSYGTRTDVFSQFSFCLKKGEITAVVGESGCGKTTMVATANVEAIISNANLNATIGQVVADSLSNNKETYTLDYNIALPFGRNAFGFNVNNYVK
jgi:ABC-type transport system involved in cytochrome bd biosynthesis fused ATPase/permease subunit